MSFELFMLGKARKETIVSIGGKIMANLSQQRREQMLSFLETLKEQHNDDASLIAINQIEKELTSKKYGLVWEEHEEEVDVKMKTHIPVFTEVKEKEIVGNSESDEFNFLLEGDNLHSLRLLEKTHKGKIDVIYIDPPYNTGHKDFIYDDAFVDRQDGYSHSKWISFMEKRLKIAHSLLKSSGTIFISIDDNEYGNEEVDNTVISYIDTYDKKLDDRIIKIEKDTSELLGQEKEAVVKTRINQDIFRKRLVMRYKHCCLCSVNNEKLLIASHIKPWSDT